MTIIEALHDYINQYAPLQNDRINIDILPTDAGSYSINVVPCKEWVKRYIDGSGVKQFMFNLSSRNIFDETLRNQMDNIGFYEDFSAWLDKQTMDGNLPVLGEERTADSIAAVSSAYVFSQDEKTAQYQIQCRLQYLQDNKEC